MKIYRITLTSLLTILCCYAQTATCAPAADDDAVYHVRFTPTTASAALLHQCRHIPDEEGGRCDLLVGFDKAMQTTKAMEIYVQYNEAECDLYDHLPSCQNDHSGWYISGDDRVDPSTLFMNAGPIQVYIPSDESCPREYGSRHHLEAEIYRNASTGDYAIRCVHKE